MDTQARLERANQKLTGEIIDLLGVTAVGIGECDGEPCLKVFVEVLSPGLRDTIPKTVDGFPVEIEESGPIRILER